MEDEDVGKGEGEDRCRGLDFRGFSSFEEATPSSSSRTRCDAENVLRCVLDVMLVGSCLRSIGTSAALTEKRHCNRGFRGGRSEPPHCSIRRRFINSLLLKLPMPRDNELEAEVMSL